MVLVAALLVAAVSLAACVGRTSTGSPADSLRHPATPAATSTASIAEAPGASQTTTFAIIGDYGMGNADELAVARLVESHHPGFVITTGDNYYSPAGGTGAGRFERSAGAYYGRWMRDTAASGTARPSGTAAVNAFFPSLGNHDYSDALPALDSYLAYFRLPGAGFANSSGNERYYDHVEGPVHFFVLNSNAEEPDGATSDSAQARWLQERLASSTSPWNVVYFHHPPYSSDIRHGSTSRMQWPLAAWGADAVISGHAHDYERIMRDGIVYFVNGLGGARRYAFGRPVAGSAKRYNAEPGAQIVTATDTTLDFGFYNASGQLIDRWRLSAVRP